MREKHWAGLYKQPADSPHDDMQEEVSTLLNEPFIMRYLRAKGDYRSLF